MVKTLIIFSAFLLALSKPAGAQKNKRINSDKTEVKFLEDIEVGVVASSLEERSKFSDMETKYFSQRENTPSANNSFKIENASKIQLKYALMLDVEVEQLQDLGLYSTIENWYGTRYRLGGANKDGIDCSALTQITYATQYGINLPRTAREQYDATQRISRTDLKEGDLVFFNTQGGVSHVGIYLQNNKFFHAASSGVTISDLYDPYWEKRFIGVGRYQKQPDSFVYSGL